jgi:subtilisin family serine protease
LRRLIAIALVMGLSAVTVAPAHGATDDPYLEDQWGLEVINAEEAWTISTGEGALIAILDTGVGLAHPDLAGKIVAYPDADFVDPEGGDGPQDENGHGTHVAGIAAAITNNGIGVAGTAPGARILPVRVLDEEGSGRTVDIAAGIRYAADKGADVVNLSLGYDIRGYARKLIGDLDSLYKAIDYAVDAGALVVVSAGNGPLGEAPTTGFPLCAEPAMNPEVLCVGAIDSREQLAWYSNFDAIMTSNYLVAPGGDGLDVDCADEILSTFLRGADAFCSPAKGYEAMAGTSMAAPFVSGVAALLAAKGLSNSQIMDCIADTATDGGVPGRDPVFGYGIVNAFGAVTDC